MQTELEQLRGVTATVSGRLEEPRYRGDAVHLLILALREPQVKPADLHKDAHLSKSARGSGTNL